MRPTARTLRLPEINGAVLVLLAGANCHPPGDIMINKITLCQRANATALVEQQTAQRAIIKRSQDLLIYSSTKLLHLKH